MMKKTPVVVAGMLLAVGMSIGSAPVQAAPLCPHYEYAELKEMSHDEVFALRNAAMDKSIANMHNRAEAENCRNEVERYQRIMDQKRAAKQAAEAKAAKKGAK